MLETFIPLAIIALSLDSHNSAAATAAGRAYSQQYGIERMLDEYQQRELSPTLRTELGRGVWLAKTITEQRLTFTMEFP